MDDCSLKYYSDVTSRKIDWLWYPYIPFGKITVIQGDPGEGKTTFVLSLLSIISNGEKLPFSDNCVSGKVIYQNTEDDNSDTIKPRLELHQADCTNICFIEKRSDSLSLDSDELAESVKRINARVLVLDPIQSFLGENIDMNRANVIRPRLNHLKELAEKTGCAVLLVGHLNKNSSGKANYRGLGSIDISAAARSVLVVGRLTDNPDIRILAQQKNNLGPIGKSLTFTLNDGKVDWISECDISASDLLSGAASDTETSKLTEAKQLLEAILSSGTVSYKEIISAAEEYEIGKRTLMSAKALLSIESIKKSDGWYWTLPHKDK